MQNNAAHTFNMFSLGFVRIITKSVATIHSTMDIVASTCNSSAAEMKVRKSPIKHKRFQYTKLACDSTKGLFFLMYGQTLPYLFVVPLSKFYTFRTNNIVTDASNPV